MKDSIFIFQLNKNIEMIIEPDQYEIDNLYCFWEANFSIIKNDHKIIICHYFFASYLEEFIIALEQALYNKRQLDFHFDQKIGYYWNESINGQDQEHAFNENYDVLQKYTVWEGHATMWIYNDTENNIILEITPYYPHAHNPEYSYQDFLQWIKTYQSIGKYIIPQEIARKWLTQATTILAEIDAQSDIIYNQGKL